MNSLRTHLRTQQTTRQGTPKHEKGSQNQEQLFSKSSFFLFFFENGVMQFSWLKNKLKLVWTDSRFEPTWEQEMIMTTYLKYAQYHLNWFNTSKQWKQTPKNTK